MLTTDITLIDAYKNPVRHISAEIKIYDGDTLKYTIDNNTQLKTISVERVGDNSKFYGFGVCHKANIHIIDTARELSIKAGNIVVIDIMSAEDAAMRIAPKLYITQVRRDELTNELSITAYDLLYFATGHTAAEMEIVFPATIGDYATAAADVLGVGVFYYAENTAFAISYDSGANLEGTETIREVLDAIAEATQSIYYISRYNTLIFKTADKDGAAAYTIDREQYITLDSGENRRLAEIAHVTQLGDNVSAALAVSGTTQYIRDNPFYEMREDIAEIVENALAAMGGITINQFECEWRGNPVIEIADKIALITKDGETAFSFLLDDVLEYDGTLKQRTRWKYEDSEQTHTNPSNLGDALNMTFAKVDKVNKQIEIVASEAANNSEEIAEIQLNTNNIQASVNRIETANNAAIGAMADDIATITQRVEATITAEDLQILIKNEIANGVTSVSTATGYTFDENGLTVTKTGSEMTTQITEDGMSVYRGSQEVLTANNQGVIATNLHANTYLIIGKYSRIEDYEPTRTGVFWIG